MVTKLDEKMVPEWSHEFMKIKPLGAHGRFFRFCVVLEVCVFYDEFGSAKSRPVISKFSNVGVQKTKYSKKQTIFWEGSAGEACRGGERGRVKLLEFEHSQRAVS